jgi:acetoin utilization deacetylase AcuC-like enzyme
MGSYHPESPARLTAINDHLIAQGIDAYFSYYDAPLASFDQLLRVHPASHLERVKRASPTQGIAHLDPRYGHVSTHLVGCAALGRGRLHGGGPGDWA